MGPTRSSGTPQNENSRLPCETAGGPKAAPDFLGGGYASTPQRGVAQRPAERSERSLLDTTPRINRPMAGVSDCGNIRDRSRDALLKDVRADPLPLCRRPQCRWPRLAAPEASSSPRPKPRTACPLLWAADGPRWAAETPVEHLVVVAQEAVAQVVEDRC